MSALLYYLPLFYNQYLVGLTDGAEAVRYNESGAALHQGFKACLYQAFAFSIEVRGGFVKYKDARIGKYSAGNGNTLPLSPRKLHPTLSYQRIKPIGKAVGKLLHVGCMHRLHQLRFGSIWAREKYVLTNSAFK